MVWIDIVCLVCIVLFALIGLWRGFLKSIFRLCAWIGGILGAYFSQDLIGGLVASNLEMSGFTVTLVCICVGFLVPFLLLSFVGHFLNKMVSGSVVSGINRILGGVLGIVKALILCFLFLTVMHLLPVSGDLRENRNNALSYAAYKWSLEVMGFSSEEVDLKGMAEEKVDKLTQDITDKAIEKVKEESAAAAEKAKEEAAKAVDKVKEDAAGAVESAKEKATEAKNKATDAIQKKAAPSIPDSTASK